MSDILADFGINCYLVLKKLTIGLFERIYWYSALVSEKWAQLCYFEVKFYLLCENKMCAATWLKIFCLAAKLSVMPADFGWWASNWATNRLIITLGCANLPSIGQIVLAYYRPSPISRDPGLRRSLPAADRGRSEGSGRAKACLQLIAKRGKSPCIHDKFGEPKSRVDPLVGLKIEDSPMSSHWKRNYFWKIVYNLLFWKLVGICLVAENILLIS